MGNPTGNRPAARRFVIAMVVGLIAGLALIIYSVVVVTVLSSAC